MKILMRKILMLCKKIKLLTSVFASILHLSNLRSTGSEYLDFMRSILQREHNARIYILEARYTEILSIINAYRLSFAMIFYQNSGIIITEEHVREVLEDHEKNHWLNIILLSKVSLASSPLEAKSFLLVNQENNFRELIQHEEESHRNAHAKLFILCEEALDRSSVKNISKNILAEIVCNFIVGQILISHQDKGVVKLEEYVRKFLENQESWFWPGYSDKIGWFKLRHAWQQWEKKTENKNWINWHKEELPICCICHNPYSDKKIDNISEPISDLERGVIWCCGSKQFLCHACFYKLPLIPKTDYRKIYIIKCPVCAKRALHETISVPAWAEEVR